MRFKALIWKSGDSKVLTVPSKLEIDLGSEYWVTLEGVEDGKSSD